jgi:predicted Zn-dependent protease
MPRPRAIFSVLSLFLAITVAAHAQATPTSPRPAGIATETANIPMHGSAGGVTLVLSVVDEHTNRLDRQAMVGLYDENTKRNAWQQTSKGSEATFDELGVGKYDVQVTAYGYITGRKEVEVTSLRQREQMKVQVVLHPDPDAVELKAANESLPEKANKEAQRGVSDLEFGKLQDAQKHLDNALKQAPSSAYANFLLGFLYFRENHLDQAQTYLTKATTLDPHDVQALNLLGRLYLARQDFANAKTTMEQATAADPENPTAHGLLADAYLNQSDYKNALAQADLAIAKGKSTASNAEIVRGEALANLGRDDEAIQALNTYLNAAPDTVAGPQVREFIAAIQQRHPNSPASTTQPTKP